MSLNVRLESTLAGFRLAIDEGGVTAVYDPVDLASLPDLTGRDVAQVVLAGGQDEVDRMYRAGGRGKGYLFDWDVGAESISDTVLPYNAFLALSPEFVTVGLWVRLQSGPMPECDCPTYHRTTRVTGVEDLVGQLRAFREERGDPDLTIREFPELNEFLDLLVDRGVLSFEERGWFAA